MLRKRQLAVGDWHLAPRYLHHRWRVESRPACRRSKKQLQRCPVAKLIVAVFGLLALTACGTQGLMPPSTPPAHDFAAQFDALWNTFDQQYAFFGQKKVDWNAARERFRPQAIAATSETQLVAVVQAMLGTLRDQHVVLRDPQGRVLPTWSPNFFVNWDEGVWRQYVQRAGWVQEQQNWGYAIFRDGGNAIPYLAIGSWRPDQVKLADLDAVMELFRNAPALIIDVRMNGGGDAQLAYDFAARFASAPRPAEYLQFRSGPGHSDFGGPQQRSIAPRGSWQFTRPVLLLTGRGSASANESFIAAMRELPNVTTIGDTTAGSSGNPAVYQLGAGWTFTVSRAIDYTAEQQVIEDAGIAPQVAIAASLADFEQGRDPVLEFALSQFNIALQPVHGERPQAELMGFGTLTDAGL
jgi:carboxyl-terminal processing protease